MSLGVNLFPGYCYFCKKKRKTVKEKVQICHQLTLNTIEETIKKAAELRNDEDVLLLAKQFQVHDKCRLDYTRKRDSIENGEKDIQTFGNFDAVKNFLEDHVLKNNQAASMSLIHDLYADDHNGDARYRSKLKQKIVEAFPEKLLFLTIDGKSPQVVVSSEGIYSKNMMGCNEALLQEAAKYLQSEVLAYKNSLPELPWPPQIDTLVKRSELIPSSLINFLNILLKSTNHPNSEKVSCMVASFSQDLIHGISRGRVVTLNHYLLGLHNITGQKLPIQILANLGHSLTYKSVCQTETAEAEIARQLYDEGTYPGLRPLTADDSVFTYFWADNFNRKVDSEKGTNIIDSTHLIKFQEESPRSVYQTMSKTVPKDKTKISCFPLLDQDKLYIDTKEEPQIFEIQGGNRSCNEVFNVQYFL